MTMFSPIFGNSSNEMLSILIECGLNKVIFTIATSHLCSCLTERMCSLGLCGLEDVQSELAECRSRRRRRCRNRSSSTLDLYFANSCWIIFWLRFCFWTFDFVLRFFFSTKTQLLFVSEHICVLLIICYYETNLSTQQLKLIERVIESHPI